MSAPQRTYAPKWQRPPTTKRGTGQEDREANEGLHKQRNPQPPSASLTASKGEFLLKSFPIRFNPNIQTLTGGGPPSGRPPRDPVPFARNGALESGRSYRPKYGASDNGWPQRDPPPRPTWDLPPRPGDWAESLAAQESTAGQSPIEHRHHSPTASPNQSARHTRFPPSPRATPPRSPSRNELTREEKLDAIGALVSSVKSERSPSPAALIPTSSTPKTQGWDLIPMRPDCQKGARGYLLGRQSWKEDVINQYAAMGKRVKLLIRADGMAVEWVLASSENPTDALPDPSTAQSQATRATGLQQGSSTSNQVSDATLAVARSALDRLGVNLHSTIDAGGTPTDARSFSPDSTSSDSSGLAPRKRKRLQHSKASSPDRGKAPKHRKGANSTGSTANPSRERGATQAQKRNRDRLPSRSALFDSLVPEDSDQPLDPGPSNISSRTEKASSKKRKKKRVVESETDEPVPSSTAKLVKEKPLKVLPIYEESNETVAQVFLMQYIRLFDTNRSALRNAYHPDATFSYQMPMPTQASSNLDVTDPRRFASSSLSKGWRLEERPN
ncbi:hypothetical protein FRB90_007383 [Tulasnella sp. 427]|nr:hypothetical protein FRB90_007383 [Tulasnella sp. 427]